MEASVMFVDCPACMNNGGSARCGLPAEVEGRYPMTGTMLAADSAAVAHQPWRNTTWAALS
jgi:hypothetical protein